MVTSGRRAWCLLAGMIVNWICPACEAYPRLLDKGTVDTVYLKEIADATVAERSPDGLPDPWPPVVVAQDKLQFRAVLAEHREELDVSATATDLESFLEWLVFQPDDVPEDGTPEDDDEALAALEATVDGYYNSQTRQITVQIPETRARAIEDASQWFNRDIAGELLLSHELTHALQDHKWDLAARSAEIPEGDTEAWLTWSALVEGEAQLVEVRTALLPIYREDDIPGFIREVLQAGDDEEDEDMSAAQRFHTDVLQFTYLEGGRFVNALHETGGWDSVDEAFRAPPTSTEQIIHPHKYFSSEEPVALDPPTQALNADGEVTLGEAIIRALFRSLELPRHVAWAAASGWGNDRAYRLPDGSWQWRTAWDEPRDADEFATTAQDVGWIIERHGPLHVTVIQGATSADS